MPARDARRGASSTGAVLLAILLFLAAVPLDAAAPNGARRAILLSELGPELPPPRRATPLTAPAGSRAVRWMRNRLVGRTRLPAARGPVAAPSGRPPWLSCGRDRGQRPVDVPSLAPVRVTGKTVLGSWVLRSTTEPYTATGPSTFR